MIKNDKHILEILAKEYSIKELIESLSEIYINQADEMSDLKMTEQARKYIDNSNKLLDLSYSLKE